MKRHLARFLMVWSIWFTMAGSMVCAESFSLLEGRIKIYPAQRDGQLILIPFAKPPHDDEEVLLLHSSTAVSHLKRLQKKTIKPMNMVNPQPHYVYGLAEGRLSDSEIQFLVAVGKAITPLVKWKGADAMRGGESATECMTADKGFVTNMIQVLTDEELNLQFYYLQEELLQSGLGTMTEKDSDSAIWMKEIVGLISPEGHCQVLAYNGSDAYGLNSTGTPVGPIFGTLKLSSNRSMEQWLVLKSAMKETWGYTFIRLHPLPSNALPTRGFLVEDRA